MKRRAAACTVCALSAILCVSLILFLRGTRNVISADQSPASPGWTVLVYMVGSDLESAGGLAERDLIEMQASVRDDTTLLVMTGGARRWFSGSPAEGCLLYEIIRDGRTLRESYPENSVSDPSMLKKLLETGLARREGPAALILWNHGFGAMGGFGRDEQADGRSLSLKQIANVLEDFGCHERPLTAVGFDCCLMAGCETAYAVRPYAEFLVASEETEPPEGWDYAFLADLLPGADGAAFGLSAVRRFAAFYEEHYASFPDYWQPYTLSAIDLGAAGVLLEETESFLTGLDGTLPESFPLISRARTEAWSFGRVASTTEYDLVDLCAFASRCGGSDRLLAAAERCVLARSGNLKDVCGLSIHIPCYADSALSERWHAGITDIQLPDGWERFLRRFAGELYGEPGLTSAKPAEPEGYSVTLSEEQLNGLSRAKYYVLCGSESKGLYLLYAGNNVRLEGDRLTALYDGRVLCLQGEGEPCQIVAFWITGDGSEDYYQAYGLAEIPFTVPSSPLGEELTVPETESFASKAAALRIIRDKKTGKLRLLTAFDTSGELVTGR
ncbi:MAG: hypothetical protein IKI84_04820 [Clostridia bacterium]|nr:hypothetical protein [Clostridia bacterium]